MISVIACPNPMTFDRVFVDLREGVTVEDCVAEAAAACRVGLDRFARAGVVIGDYLVPPAQWATVKPKDGQTVIVRAVAGDPISLSIAAAGTLASSFAGTLGLSALTTGLIQAGIGLVTSLLVGALSPTPKQRSGGRQEQATARYSVQGVRNEARPFGTIPRIYGRRVRYFPLLAAQPYTETWSGDDQYIRMLFDVGYGPLSITNIRVGDTPLEQLKGAEVQIRQGYPGDAPITLFPSQVREQSLNIQLRQVGGFSIQTSAADADEGVIDIAFPAGLQRITDRNIKFAVEVGFEAQIRLASGGPWLAAPLVQDSGSVEITGGTGLFQIRANSKSAVRRSVRIIFPSRNQWQVQVRRLTQDDQSDNTGDNQSVTSEDSYLTAFRSVTNVAPTNKTGIARIAVRLKATDQINGVIEQLNCTVQAILPVWNGSAWVEQETRSPAWAFADVLRGSANARPLAASRLDLARLLEWDAQCSSDGVTFDAVLDQRSSVLEVIDDIAGTANAKRVIRNGLYSVALDNEKTTVVQHFSPRNSRGFGSTKVFATRPHGIKVLFPNESTYHQQDQIIVYDDGYSASNATLFETLELPYTTSAAQAWRRGRRAMFAARLRPEVYTLETDIEHIVCEPGDLVRVTHDVPMWGVSAARVKTLATSGSDTTGVTLDAAVPMSGGAAYACRFRLASGSTLVVPVNTVAGNQTALTFTSAVSTASGPTVGDLVLFGESGTESVELVVRSIEPLPDLAARITFQDYAPAIQTAATGEVPEFDPQITLPPVVNRDTPPRVQVLSVDSDEDVLIRASDGTLTSRILVAVALDQASGTVAAEIIQARYREAGTVEDFVWLGTIPAGGGTVSVIPVQDGTAYELQFRSVSQAGATSEWTGITHTVVGKTTPPPSVERFYRQGNVLIWPYPSPPVDLAGFLIRANYGTSTDWGLARPLHPGVVTAPPFDISALHGTQTILIRAVDTSGIESATAASVTIDLGDLIVANVVDTQSEGPTWSGTLTNGTDTGTDIEAALESSAPMYGAADALLYGAAGDAFYEGNFYAAMSYVARYTPDTLYLGDGVLKLELTVVGDYTVDYRISTSPAFYGAGGSAFYGTGSAAFYDPSEIGTWLPWPGTLGPFETVADSYDIRLTTVAGATQGVCSQFDLITDLPDVVETLEDVVIAATSTRLPITKTYRVIKAVNLTVQTDGNGGTTARTIDKNATLGPDVEVLNAAGTAVIGLVDAIIQGY